MISRTLESWRSLPRLTLREAAAIAGISKPFPRIRAQAVKEDERCPER